MTSPQGTGLRVAAGIVALLFVSGGEAQAQETGSRAALRSADRVVMVPRRQAATLPAPLTERRLTIQRRHGGSTPEPDDDTYLDGNVRYNNVRAFDPAPYADSGRQYPFGLDGIGGYGSDLGFGAGHDDALYDRGP